MRMRRRPALQQTHAKWSDHRASELDSTTSDFTSIHADSTEQHMRPDHQRHLRFRHALHQQFAAPPSSLRLQALYSHAHKRSRSYRKEWNHPQGEKNRMTIPGAVPANVCTWTLKRRDTERQRAREREREREREKKKRYKNRDRDTRKKQRSSSHDSHAWLSRSHMFKHPVRACAIQLPQL